MLIYIYIYVNRYIYIYIYVNRYIHARLKHTQYIIYTKSNISSFTSTNRHLRPPTVTNRKLTVQWLIFDFFASRDEGNKLIPVLYIYVYVENIYIYMQYTIHNLTIYIYICRYMCAAPKCHFWVGTTSLDKSNKGFVSYTLEIQLAWKPKALVIHYPWIK